MEPQYLPKTSELLNSVIQLRSFMSNDLPSQLMGVDISSQVSPYRQNEDSLQSALDRLDHSLSTLEARIDFVDTLPFNFKNNVHSYINQLLAWMQPNSTLQNWPNIINYSENIYTQLCTYGLSVSTVQDIEIDKLLNTISTSRRDLGDISELRALKRDLVEIKKADLSIPTAKSLISTINNFKSIEEAKRVADKILDYKDKYEDDFKQIELLKQSKTLEQLESKFKEQSKEHRKLSNKWLQVLTIALLFFGVSAVYVICLSVGIDKMTISVPSPFKVNLGFSLAIVGLSGVVLFKTWKRSKVQFFTLLFAEMLLLSTIIDGVTIPIPQIGSLGSSDTVLDIISSLLIRSIILSPAILLIIYSSKGYNRNLKLAEEYEYKFISSATFDTLIRKSVELNPAFKVQNLLEQIVSNIFAKPHENTEITSQNTDLLNVSVGNFLSSPVISKIIELGSKLRK